MDINPGLVLSIAALLLVARKDVIELVRNRGKDVKEDREELERVDRWARDECSRIERAASERIHALALDVARVQTSLDYLKLAIRQGGVDVLHDPHPEHAEKDELLDKMRVNTLEPEEIPKLIEKVIELRDDPTQTDGRRLFATLFAWSLE